MVAVIPARGGSKGVFRKNLRKINNQTILARAIFSAKASQYIDRVIVSSEDHEIIEEAKIAGAEVPFIRPFELARDDTPGIEPVLHCLSQIKSCDYVLLLQVTSPLRTTFDIDSCIEFCISNDSPACVSVVETAEHPSWMFTLDGSGKMKQMMSGEIPHRRQDLEPVYVPNGAIYIAKSEWLVRNKTFITQETSAYVMPRERSLDIDSEFDFCLLENYFNKSKNIQNQSS